MTLLAPRLVLLRRRGPRDVVHRAGARQAALPAAGRRRRRTPPRWSPRHSQPGVKPSPQQEQRAAAGVGRVGAHAGEAAERELLAGSRGASRRAARRRESSTTSSSASPSGSWSRTPPYSRSPPVRSAQKSSASSEATRKTTRCTIPSPGAPARRARVLEERDVGAGAARARRRRRGGRRSGRPGSPSSSRAAARACRRRTRRSPARRR